MHTLAIDTCFGACSVAMSAVDGGRVVLRAAAFERRDTGHAEALLPMIERMLAEAAAGPHPVALSAIGHILVTHGPGSFTGARIGVAAARALSLALGVPASGVNSIALIAFAARQTLGPGRVVVAMPGGKGDVVVQAFGNEIDLGAMPRLASPEEAARLVDIGGAALIGSAAPVLAEAAARIGRRADHVEAHWQPDATYLAALVQGHALPELPPRPLYLRPPDAKPPADPAIARA